MRRWTPALAGAILAIVALALPAAATADAGHGSSTRNDSGHAARADWSAGPVGRGTGYARRGGSRRVREVQRRLRSRGYHPGPVDGLYGPRTERAARRFQRAARLRTDAIVGPRTLRALRVRHDDRRPVAAPPPAATTLPGAIAPPEQRSASSPATPERSPFPLAAVLVVLGVLGLGAAAASYTRTRRRFRELVQ